MDVEQYLSRIQAISAELHAIADEMAEMRRTGNATSGNERFAGLLRRHMSLTSASATLTDHMWHKLNG